MKNKKRTMSEQENKPTVSEPEASSADTMSENATMPRDTMSENEVVPQDTMSEGEGILQDAAGASCAVRKRGKLMGAIDAFFGITARGSDFRREIIAGITTFMAMVYALLVVPGMFPEETVSFGAVYVATALGAIVGTMIMAFLAKMPLAQASGLGATAYVAGTLLGGGLGLTYANSMIFVLFDGAVFVLLTVTGLRKMIFTAIPAEVRIVIPVGIGLFIAFIGFNNAGIVTLHEGSIGFASFNVLSGSLRYCDAIGAFVALLGVVAIGVLSKKDVKGSILWGMLGAAVLYYALLGLGCAWNAEGCREAFSSIGANFEDPFSAFAAWGKESVGQVFAHGFVFSGYLAEHSAGELALLIVTSGLSLCMVDMFDTLGTLYGACARGGLLDEQGNPLRLDKCMLSNAVATCAGAAFGATTVATYVESASGVAAGGKTGFASVITAICFTVAMFLSPIAKLIPSCATAAALIWVGVLMMTSVKDVDWSDPAAALPAFLTVTVMAFGYSISYGIGIGIISCVLVKVCTGKVKEISPVTWIIAALFLLMFLFTN